MKFVNGLVVNETKALHLLAHLWCYYFLVHSKYSQDVTIYFILCAQVIATRRYAVLD